MKSSLGLRLGQSLTMTPALQQAIRLLQLSSLDLQQEIEQALDANILLERDEAATDDEAPAAEATETTESGETETLELGDDGAIPDEMPVDADWGDVFDDLPAQPRSSDDDELREFLEANLHKSLGLREHLLEQARVAPFDPEEAPIASYLIDAIDEDGYLRDWPSLLEELSVTLGASAAEVEAVLAKLQDFDPTGVAARDLSECLRLQVESMPARTPGAQAALLLIERHLPLLARRDNAAVARASGLDGAELDAALALLRSLQPHPGQAFKPHESDYIAPDVFVFKKNGRWTVSLNPEHTPRLRINGHYQGLIRRADTSRDQQMLKQHLQEARYFLNSLEARNETLLRVAQSIVEEQRAFLEYGPEAMRPLVLRDIAEQLGIHESTVSRATANKYMLTPRGLFELKYFFSSHVQTTGGGVCSATAIQAMIKRLIGTENPARPLSDATLSELLLKEGIQVARRTVAKYREGLGIPPSHERKPLA
ncbi:RNA polymerase factor sigma-54 [Sinimarinibacterium flocculans]|uniref:RNA polymerase sigma-54 factor n=1 Tax=Sinimarinibacterium flocculans TaxID=985250 RepID=A0A318EC59_9GAMM|nr:RNA polymerase factor sigma-54 [Sinimarinibacterium flocculans]MEC9364434.1 RNA polymerase factor sigma-54 [Pseudomonadota bacterium]PXV67067.1 RNA polymerase RpoN-/SigL-like sigma 54 subunit [Sinimarinibacterium flocculans]